MRVFRPFAIAAAAIAFTASTAASSGPATPTKISETIVATWTCQDQLGASRTHAYSPWKPHSAAFRAAQLNEWRLRHRECLRTLHERAATYQRLHRGIAAYYRSQHRTAGPMTGHERELERAARRYGLSPYFIFAASITESSGALAACSSNHYNAWGLASCGGSWVPRFTSWAEAYDFYGRFLTGRTRVSRGWPHARTTYDYHGYAACSACWGRKTAEHMRHFFGVDHSTRYQGVDV